MAPPILMCVHAADRPGEVVVRVVEPTEAAAVGALVERVYRGGGWTTAAYSQLLRDVSSRMSDATVLVALWNGSPMGSVTVAEPGSTFASRCMPDEVEVRMLAVDPAVRGRGIASLLMDECEAMARRGAYRGILLSTEPNMHAAHRLYERRGYIRQPERDWRFADRVLRVYRLDLSETGIRT